MNKPEHVIALLLCCSSFGLAHAQADAKLLMKSDMNCTWTLDGKPMGSLSAGVLDVILTSQGEHVIEASSADGATVRSKVDVQQRAQDYTIELKRQSAGQLRMQPAANGQGTKGTRQDGTWTDPATQLMWTATDNGSDLDQPQAVSFCSSLKLAGHGDWQLATVEELQGIYDPSASVPSQLDDGTTRSMHVKGNLQLTGRAYWTSRQTKNTGKPYEAAWYFEFGGSEPERIGVPGTNFVHYTWNSRALCVRRAEGMK